LLEKKILQIVKNVEVFKCSDSTKKKPYLFNLRKKVPPNHNYLQRINIPAGALTEDLFKKLKVKFIETSLVKSESKTQLEGSFYENNKNQRNDTDREMEICDSSDETSSKSTLDLIIPPPDNFKGSNNPFHINYRTDIKMKGFEKISGSKRNSFTNKFPEVRIVRTIKRRLSAKDLLVGPNQEVKRRKIYKRRKSSNVEVISEIIQPINMPLPTYIPLRSESATNYLRTSNSLTSVLKNEMNSRKQQIKSENFKSFQSDISANEPIKINLTDTVTNSPVKNNSINMYFGAMNRIDSGEKFTILAKRITFDGKKQYLLDWDCKNGTVIQNES
jgi:Polycomb-like MTF2 factor 2